MSAQVIRWAPQNDLLGSANMRAFLTHGGSNSMYEAAYHGIPIIGMPAPLADQRENVAKAVQKVGSLACWQCTRRHCITAC